MRDIWVKATVIGSLWAVIEIVVGSFLHNLRVPLAGSILAFSSVILLVAFLRIWPEKGLAVRAALIAALMKSISPSAVIIGPMTGIFLEGLLMELALAIFGVNRLAFLVGGMLAVWSALLHKLVTLLLVYGTDLVVILENLYQFAVRQIRLPGQSLWEPVLLLSLLYLLTGAFAAVVGMKISLDQRSKLRQTEADDRYNLFEMTDQRRYSLLNPVIIAAGLTGVLGLMNLVPVWIFLPVSLAYLVFLALRYRRAIRPLTRPKFWIQLLVITFLVALLIDGLETGVWFAWHGFEAGLLINLRALTVLMSFTALGTELKNPLIKTLLYRRGFAPLYRSLQMAFSLLPTLLAQLPSRIRSLREIPALAASFLGLSAHLYEVYARMSHTGQRVFLVVGDRQAGKTTFIESLVHMMTESGIGVGGFVARVQLANGQVSAYRLHVLDTGSSHDFCLREGQPDWERVGRFYIDPAGLQAGEEAFRRAISHPPAVFVVDEVGPLEMQNRGWSDGIRELCALSQLVQIWSVRPSLARKVTRKWPGFQYSVISLNEHPDAGHVMKQITLFLTEAGVQKKP